MWHQKNKVWALIDKMVQSGFSAEVAINRIEQVYGSDVSITMLIQKIMANKDGHLSLR
jgi:orotate phosphoribosyltransferase-like protein